ncbi:MAG: isocitrate/isopropylmalate dehydrogenase [Haloquadratum sp. J07HQX50]|nr:MAG: isocitrate/isopropylmalate dehydrogenase [Haloquadratum sp. J07HQX50]
MESYQIALIPGDGIGPTVVEKTRPLIDAVAHSHDFAIEYNIHEWGSERYLETDAMMPDDSLSQLRPADAIFVGAVGHPDIPDHITLNGLLLPIRKAFDQYICKRPSVLYPGVESPLRGYTGRSIDFVVFRENTEGEYADIGGREHQGFQTETAVQSALFTREGVTRIAHAAFEAASARRGHLTNVTKSNAQAYGMVLWDDVIETVAEDYPDVTVEHLLVDAASMDLIRRPHEFDVIVASNLFGDIITDIGAQITGSMGLAPSANINPDPEYPSMFEPVHGSAPDIAGEQIANPLATVLSWAMLFEEIDETAAAETLREGVSKQLTDTSAPRTPDLGGDASTERVISDLQTRV